MHPCPRCGVAAFRDGRCHQCGFTDPRYAGVRIVTGQGAPAAPPWAPAAPPPIALDPAALTEVDGGPSLPGFESTSLTPTAPRAAPSPAPDRAQVEADGDYVYQACPRCGTAQPDPPDTFCAHCGYRVKRRLRARGSKHDRTRTCRECGTPNPPGDSAVCVNCGFPLPSDE